MKLPPFLPNRCLANSGCCEPQDGFLQSIVDLCREHGAVSIFDEVITGFRLARGGAREYYNVHPDLSVYGKALAGGFTLVGRGWASSMFDVLRDGRTIHVGTYNGNPICLAAASATLEILANPSTFARMHAHGQALQQIIRDTAADPPSAASDLRGRHCLQRSLGCRSPADRLSPNAAFRHGGVHAVSSINARPRHLPAARRPLVCRRHAR